MRKVLQFLKLGIFLVLSLYEINAIAQVPMLLHHQGRILDNNGQPISGIQTLTFKLYSSPTSPAELWSETVPISFKNGYFSTILGINSQLKLSIFQKNSPLYMGITIGNSGKELKPRIKLVSVPFALLADTAKNVIGGTIDVKEIKIGGKVIVDSKGVWKGPSSGLQGPPGSSCTITNTSTDAQQNTLITFKCGKNTTQITVKRGAIGPKGPAGPKGPKGDPGPPGPVGCKKANTVIKSDGKKAVCTAIYDNGKGDVGISTSKPRATLEVNNTLLVGKGAVSSAVTTRQDGTLELSGASNHLSIVKRGLKTWPSKPKPGDRWSIDNISGTLGFWSQSYMMSLTAGGFLGLNTRSPLGRLDVANSFGKSIMRVMAGDGKRGYDADFLTVFARQNNSTEGGQAIFEGAGNYQDWTIDTYRGDLRFFEPAPSRDNKKKVRGGILFMVSHTLQNGTSIATPRLHILRDRTFSYQPMWIKTNFDSPITYQSTDNTWLYTQWYDSKQRRAWVGFNVNFSVYNFQLENDRGSGYFYFNRIVRAPRFIATSDLRLKLDVTPVREDILQKIKQLHLYSYKLKGIKGRTLGISADDVEKVFPQLVVKDEMGYKSVDYSALTAVTLKGLRELNRKVAKLSSKFKENSSCKKISKFIRILSQKDKEISSLKDRVRILEKELKASRERYKRMRSELRAILQKLQKFER